MILASSDRKELAKREIQYTISGSKKMIPLDECVFFYDLAPGMRDEEYFKSPSRIEAALKSITNIDMLQDAQNVNINWSKKFLTTNKTKDDNMMTEMEPEEKLEIENRLFSKDIMASQKDLQVSSLANDFTKLVYDEQMAHCMQRVCGVFGIKKEVFSWFIEGQSTYENKEVVVPEWIQNTMQNEVDDFANTYQSQFKLSEKGEKIKGSFDHLPIMQKLKVKDREAREKCVAMFKDLKDSGMDETRALMISGLDKYIEDEKK